MRRAGGVACGTGAVQRLVGVIQPVGGGDRLRGEMTGEVGQVVGLDRRHAMEHNEERADQSRNVRVAHCPKRMDGVSGSAQRAKQSGEGKEQNSRDAHERLVLVVQILVGTLPHEVERLLREE